MAKTDFKSVDEYIATHPENVQAILQRVRAAIGKALPDAEEVISYQIPAYKLQGERVIFFAGWKQHFSLYPATGALVEALGDELSRYELSKGTIRFPLSDPVPVTLIERIARFRAQETVARQQAKTKVSGAKARSRTPSKSPAGKRSAAVGSRSRTAQR